MTDLFDSAASASAPTRLFGKSYHELYVAPAEHKRTGVERIRKLGEELLAALLYGEEEEEEALRNE